MSLVETNMLCMMLVLTLLSGKATVLELGLLPLGVIYQDAFVMVSMMWVVEGHEIEGF